MRDSIFFRSSVVIFSLLTAAIASADCVRLVSISDPTQPNAFTLNFPPEYGGTRQAAITLSEITLATCDSPAAARFPDYYQEAESLTLPGGIPTGALTIRIRLSQSQSFDPASGQFGTMDYYAIFFTGDLSAYGIYSPFYLPGMSGGVITHETPSTGTISMNWAGEAALPNPFDPAHPIGFTYTCQVNTRFTAVAGCAADGCDGGDLNGDCSVGLGDLAGLLGNFGMTGAQVRPQSGDLNGDFAVGLSDLTLLLSQFGNDCH